MMQIKRLAFKLCNINKGSWNVGVNYKPRAWGCSRPQSTDQQDSGPVAGHKAQISKSLGLWPATNHRSARVWACDRPQSTDQEESGPVAGRKAQISKSLGL